MRGAQTFPRGRAPTRTAPVLATCRGTRAPRTARAPLPAPSSRLAGSRARGRPLARLTEVFRLVNHSCERPLTPMVRLANDRWTQTEHVPIEHSHRNVCSAWAQCHLAVAVCQPNAFGRRLQSYASQFLARLGPGRPPLGHLCHVASSFRGVGAAPPAFGRAPPASPHVRRSRAFLSRISRNGRSGTENGMILSNGCAMSAQTRRAEIAFGAWPGMCSAGRGGRKPRKVAQSQPNVYPVMAC